MRSKVIFALAAGLSSCAISIHCGLSTANILILFIFMAIFYFSFQLRDSLFQRERINAVAFIVACVFSTFLSLKGMECFDRYPSVTALGKLVLISCQFFGFLFLIYVSCVFLYTKSVSMIPTNMEAGFWKKDSFVSRNFFVLVFITMLILWVPYYLIDFPGVVISDSADQIQQAFGAYPYSNHHPILQTWIIKGIFNLGLAVFGEINYAVALYSILQMIIMALGYSYFINRLKKQGYPLGFVLAVFLYFSIMPYNVMYSFTMWKDSIFSLCVFVFCVILWENTVLNQEEGTERKTGGFFQNLLFFVSGVGICLFRNNGFYLYIVMLPFLIVFFRKRSAKKLGISILILMITLVFRGPVMELYAVKNPDSIESLSIPIQQVARVISEELEITSSQEELLENIITVNKIKENYNPHISDPMKGLIREKGNIIYFEENKGAYLRLWLELLRNYPTQYVRAYIDQTSGYWYPDTQYWIYAHGTYDAGVGITEQPLLGESVSKYLRWPLWNYQDFPFLGLLFSIGAAVWTMFYLLGLCIIRKEYRNLIVFLPVILLWGTLLVATPVYAEFRYIYALFLCLPIYIAYIFESKNLKIT